ncbi:hypothetical protein HELRODRAFT_190447 [Helobdella robusta]|uniref:Uncharacterized protein n=1 Tax=Helobdella robusta TaxID=6412 RepID=T1FS01_HELRO|nr:hypothetical protein HELRODRAFT_190447 [Helobdella robusta]ESO09296.1 hypothetical protein HELRODRAFT_190447 [Helobdella robusta]
MSAFNKNNVDHFYNNLHSTLIKHPQIAEHHPEKLQDTISVEPGFAADVAKQSFQTSCDENLSSMVAITPESVRPYPKAPARQVRKTKRKKLTSRVLTDTPVKEELRVQQTREEIKKRPIMNKRKLQQNKKNQISEESNRVTKKNKIKRQLYAEKDICVMCGEAGRDN